MTSTTTASGSGAAEAFGARVLDIFNDAAVALLLSIGHQTGLFDSLAAMPGAATSTQIANASGLNERYVREWLGGMVTNGIVDYDPADATYTLPAHHAPALTRAGGPANVAAKTPFIAVLGEVEQQIIECFRNGGGLGYSNYPRFHAVRAESSGRMFDSALIDTILPLAGRLSERMREGIDVADFGCGTGHAVNVLARQFRASRFTGYDFATEAIDTARAEAATLDLSNTSFEVQDLAVLATTEAFDAVLVFDAIHDQAKPAAVLSNIYRSLRPGGVLLMVDFKASSHVEKNKDIPWAGWLYTVSTMHCMTVSLSAGGAGLGTAWGEELAVSMLRDAGFTQVDVTGTASDPFNNYYIARK